MIWVHMCTWEYFHSMLDVQICGRCYYINAISSHNNLFVILGMGKEVENLITENNCYLCKIVELYFSLKIISTYHK